MLRKITGDPNVPAGRITVKADNGILQVGGGRSSAIAAKVQIRANVDKLNGFSSRIPTVMWSEDENIICIYKRGG